MLVMTDYDISAFIDTKVACAQLMIGQVKWPHVGAPVEADDDDELGWVLKLSRLKQERGQSSEEPRG